MPYFDTLVAHAHTILIPALLGAQLILSLVLQKGDICPGQRGRVHKILPVIIIGWALLTWLAPIVLLPLIFLTAFTVKVKISKTRDKGPIILLNLSNVAALISLGWLITQKFTLFSLLFILLLVVILGSSLAHLFLLQARSRLQAFHKILPVVGTVAVMLLIMTTLIPISALEASLLQQITPLLLSSFVLLVMGVVGWVWHLIRVQTVSKVQISLSLILLSSSLTLQTILL